MIPLQYIPPSLPPSAIDSLIFSSPPGGPGCSGLLGFFTENGPFRPSVDGASLYINPYRWNKISNMAFIEIPGKEDYFGIVVVVMVVI